MRGNEKFVKKQAKLIDLLFTVLNSRVKPLEFLSISLPLIPHQIGIG